MFNFYPGLPHVLFDDVHMHTQPHTQRFPEPDTKSAGTETSQVLNMKVCGLWRVCSLIYLFANN